MGELTDSGRTVPPRRWGILPTREVIGNPKCPLIHRWTLLDIRVGKLLLHHFMPNGEDVDFHDHPRGFVTFVVKGRYADEAPRERVVVDGNSYNLSTMEVMSQGRVRYRPASYMHRTHGGPRGAWTIVVMGPLVRKWGFIRDGRWMGWRSYLERYGNDAQNRCP